jgi:hypothetical protein
VLPDDREILLNGVFSDSGANLLLVTEALCKEIALHFKHSDDVPGVRGWGGSQERKLIGYTGPFRLVLAKGTSHETTLHVARAYVVPGNANGMYKVCLDKQTVYSIYGHVNPLWQHFVWFPDAASGNLRRLAGIPVQCELKDEADYSAPLAAVDLDFFACAAESSLIQDAFSLDATADELADLPALVPVSDEDTQTLPADPARYVVTSDEVVFLGRTFTAAEASTAAQQRAAVLSLPAPSRLLDNHVYNLCYLFWACCLLISMYCSVAKAMQQPWSHASAAPSDL